MSLKNQKIVEEFIVKTLQKKDEQQKKSKEILDKLFSEQPIEERKPPKDFKDSSFLYIRSFNSDTGLRPFSSGIYYGDSPDLQISPINNEFTFTTELKTGQTYKLKCMVRNRGDVNVPSAKVEFFLITPSVGYFARPVDIIGVVDTWVSPYSSSETSISYTVPANKVGHKCLFARIFSFSPLDVPLDDNILNPTMDRHVAQKNLNIISQGTTFIFNLVHFPNADVLLNISPILPPEILKLGITLDPNLEPVVLEGISERIILQPIEKNKKLEIVDKENNKFLMFRDKSEFSTEIQKEIFTKVMKSLKQIQKGEKGEKLFKEVLKKFRLINTSKETTGFQFDTKFGLPVNAYGGFNITALDQNTNEEIGGITVIVVNDGERR